MPIVVWDRFAIAKTKKKSKVKMVPETLRDFLLLSNCVLQGSCHVTRLRRSCANSAPCDALESGKFRKPLIFFADHRKVVFPRN